MKILKIIGMVMAVLITGFALYEMAVYQGWIKILPDENKLIASYKAATEDINERVNFSAKKEWENLEAYFVKHPEITAEKKKKYRDFIEKYTEETLADLRSTGNQYINAVLRIYHDPHLVQGQRIKRIARCQDQFVQQMEHQRIAAIGKRAKILQSFGLEDPRTLMKK